MLGTLILAFDDNAGRQVGNTNCRVGGVNVLTARAGGAEGIDAQVARVDIRHFGFRELRHHRHGAGGGVDTPLGFGGRDALNAMAAGFELQSSIDAVAADFGNHLFEAAVLAFVGAHDFHAPAA